MNYKYANCFLIQILDACESLEHTTRYKTHLDTFVSGLKVAVPKSCGLHALPEIIKSNFATTLIPASSMTWEWNCFPEEDKHLDRLWHVESSYLVRYSFPGSASVIDKKAIMRAVPWQGAVTITEIATDENLDEARAKMRVGTHLSTRKAKQALAFLEAKEDFAESMKWLSA